MNAVEEITRRLPAEAVRRLAVLPVNRFDRPVARRGPAVLDNAAAAERVRERWLDDLCGLLNAMTRAELLEVARAWRLEVSAGARSWQLRALVWDAGARLERGGADVGPGLQPRPVLLGGHLVLQAPPRGLFPPSPAWPRPLPAPRPADPPAEEPDTVDELLAAADRALGVRLGARGRDKGAWGMRAQALLGVADGGDDEPDWRGDVEIKTVPVAREPSGLWRVVEDPAIAMVGEGVLSKLQRTLWLARADVDDGDATLVSWYLLDWDADVARLTRRYLHERPKGPRGTEARGKYLSKRFFADAGLLASLNGPAGSTEQPRKDRP